MTRDTWDRAAASFDDEPDHGLADETTRAAWRALLLGVLPAAPGRIADLGCGTGTLSRLLVDEGYEVDGLDFSPAMIELARAKVPEARFTLGDASDPGFDTGSYDAVLWIVRTARVQVDVQPLPDPIYWGKEINDERYLLVSKR